MDESGDHSLEAINPDYPLFVLAFCIMRTDDYAHRIVPALQTLKFDTFGHSMTVLHSRDIRKQHGDFVFLRHPEKRSAFLSGISQTVSAAPFTLVVTAIDKERYSAQHRSPDNPYHLSLRYCLERTHELLMSAGQEGRQTHIIAESRGKAEDADLSLAFLNIIQDNDHWSHRFTLRFAPKACNSSGLQLADLAAHPVGRHVLKPEQPNKAFDIVKGKLMAREPGGYHGVGLKVLP